MIITNDGKHAFLAVPKTGSASATDLIKTNAANLVLVSPLNHPTAPEFIRYLHTNNITIDPDIRFYAFWRDPVERFFSACAYVKKQPEKTIRNTLHDYFSDCNAANFQTKLNALTTSDFISIIDSLERPTAQKIFLPQHPWYDFFIHDELQLLPFSDYTNQLTKLATIFGVDNITSIPAINYTGSVVSGTDAELATIRDLFKQDYTYSLNPL